MHFGRKPAPHLSFDILCFFSSFLCSLNIQNTNPEHGLTAEEMFPFVSRVIMHANNWMVHTMALLVRSRLESKKSRTVERAALQLQALVDQFGVDDSTVEHRLAHIFSVAIPAKWEMEVTLFLEFLFFFWHD